MEIRLSFVWQNLKMILKTYSKIDRNLLNSIKIRESTNDTIVQSVEETKKAIEHFQEEIKKSAEIVFKNK